MSWTLAQAKDQLSEVVRRANDQGPQTISVRGKDAAVVMSKAQYETLVPSVPGLSFRDHILAFPKIEGVDFERDKSPARDVEF